MSKQFSSMNFDSTLQDIAAMFILQRQELEQAKATINDLLQQRDAICAERKEAEDELRTARQFIQNWNDAVANMCLIIREERENKGDPRIPRNDGTLLVDEIQNQAAEICRLNAEVDKLKKQLEPKQTPEQGGFTMEIFFHAMWNELQADVHNNAISKGWWDAPERSTAECIALMHSELSEALEADRHENALDDKIPAYSGLEAELADVVIRIMDFAGRKNLRLAEAITTKAAFNKTRPYKHGKKY